MAQHNLYYRTQLVSHVTLTANQIDANIDDHLLENLRYKLQGKTNEYGVIIKIDKIIDYGLGMITNSNLMASVVYEVKYMCLLCSPIKNMEVICKVDNTSTRGIIVASNGPLIIPILLTGVPDGKIFEIVDDAVIGIKNKKKIEPGDIIKVSFNHFRIIKGEPNIQVLSKLINFATKEEIESYNRDMALINDNDENDTDDSEFI